MLLSELLSLETEELLHYKFAEYGFLLWPFVRAYVLNQIYINHTNSSVSTARSERLTFYENISYLYNTIKGNPFKYSHYKIVFILSQIACSIKKDGKYFNRLHDYFALAYPACTLIIEKSVRKKYTLPRYFENLALEDYINIKPYLKTIFKRPNSKDVDTITLFIKCLAALFKDYKDYLDLHYIYYKLLKFAATYALLYQNHIDLFKKLKPEIIFVYLASGGRNRIFAIKAAKALGVKVGEFQHGAITLAHPYYNYGKCVFESSVYREYLPDYLLTWGEFWNNNMVHPSKKVIIGNPHFTTKQEEFNNIKRIKSSEKNVVLIVSQGTITNSLVEITKALSRRINCKKYEFIFRLHPGEVPFVDRYKTLCALPNVKISKNGDVYDLLFHSDYIIACYSTIIFEGIGLRKPVFILDNYWSRTYIPTTIGKWFNNVDELYDLLTSTTPAFSEINTNIEYYFAPSWQKNYRDFIENEIKISDYS